jgi:tetratricopeptide (TPR) repeat protein
MRCPNCGEELEAGNIFCKKCGQEQQIVPDYDPLDELILDHTEPHKKVKEKERKEDNRKQEKQTVHRKNPSTVQRVALLMLFILLGFGVFLASYFSISREKSYSYQLKKGMALADREEYEKAFPYLKKAYELQSESEGSDTRPLRYMAKTYAAMGAKQLAVECMDEAVNMEANAREDNYELEEIYLELMDILNETGQTELSMRRSKTC